MGARRGIPGTPGGPLRTREFPNGLPSLTGSDAQKVLEGNKLLAASLTIIRVALKHGVPVTFENPQGSRMWWTPQSQRLLARSDKVLLDFCCFGTRWRKPTRLATWNIDLSGLRHRCAPINNCCSTSGQPHVILQGGAPGGERWTKIAEPYPVPFCTAYARTVVEKG